MIPLQVAAKIDAKLARYSAWWFRPTMPPDLPNLNYWYTVCGSINIGDAPFWVRHCIPMEIAEDVELDTLVDEMMDDFCWQARTVMLKCS